ncbi:thiol:disulfide interchange protein DsbG [Chromobacterium alkanivorans]|uniref:thiol:disulfide interchange protein DsbG n=1 Tax=Chromobacterium alkanivorans TaxID=1071719 RepID=UPI0019678183|nr:thiol:disulfide interchange protein DsbG [Chromobacterium alkanivorans]MBN3006225.1 thiol:disulfide interchange protein DsbG [Chromobacterium alkanivorans]
MLFKTIPPLLLALSLPVHALAAPARPAPIQALERQGYQILDSFPGPGGLTGYAALYLGRPQTLYLTPDRKQAIVGQLSDANGEPWNAPLLNKQFSQVMWRQLEASHWVADGDARAPRVVYAFTDPNCPFCNRFWQDARPWVQAGKVQIRHILVGVIKADSPGKAAAILAAVDPAATLNRHERQHASGGVAPLAKPPAAVSAKLAANHQLMERFGVFATPVIFYPDPKGDLQKIQGAPNAERLLRILGPR